MTFTNTHQSHHCHMGNDCWNQLTITCESSADTLNDLIANEIEYRPNDEYDEATHSDHVRIVKRGKHGIYVDMRTKWLPDFKWLNELLDKYPQCWVKNIWQEEGGLAGVWVGFVDGETGEKKIQEMRWNDLCLEQKVYFFDDDDADGSPSDESVDTPV